MRYELGEVICERGFEARDENGKVMQVTLRVGKPQLKPTGDGELWFYCPHQIVGIGSERVRALRGMDALDALLLTLRLAHFELTSYAHIEHKTITWLGEDWLGLPEIEAPDEANEGDAGFDFKGIFEEYFRRLGEDGT